MNYSDAVLLAKEAEMTLSEKGLASAKVILTGFVVVFAVLLLLILIIKIYGAIVTKAQQASKNRAKKKIKVKEEVQPEPVSAPQVSPSAPVTAQDEGISDEVVAVISAAVASMYSSPEKARIKSIKESDGSRSAWANAGVLDNTRPF